LRSLRSKTIIWGKGRLNEKDKGGSLEGREGGGKGGECNAYTIRTTLNWFRIELLNRVHIMDIIRFLLQVFSTIIDINHGKLNFEI